MYDKKLTSFVKLFWEKIVQPPALSSEYPGNRALPLSPPPGFFLEKPRRTVLLKEQGIYRKRQLRVASWGLHLWHEK